MNKKQWMLWGIAAGLLVCTQAWALSVPGRTSFKVNDYARVIDPVTKQKLELLLERFEKANPRKIEFIVTTMPSLDGMSFDRFITAYGGKWRYLWPFENDRRIHLIVVMDAGQMRLGVGHPLEGELPPDKALTLLNHDVVPYFEKKQYSDGIANGVISVVNAFGGLS